MLRARPSVRIFFSCSVVTSGFFIGIFLDEVHISALGILFGISSSLMSALHAAVMKRGFEVVEDSALSMSWYSNLLSSLLLLPFVIMVGEGPAVFDILSGRAEGLTTFLIGSLVTVSSVCFILLGGIPSDIFFGTKPVNLYTLRVVSGFCSPSLVPYRSKSRPRLRI
jgi:hypothetical protein